MFLQDLEYSAVYYVGSDFVAMCSYRIWSVVLRTMWEVSVWLYVVLQDLECSAVYYVGNYSLCGYMCSYRIWSVVLCTMWEMTVDVCVLTGSGV